MSTEQILKVLIVMQREICEKLYDDPGNAEQAELLDRLAALTYSVNAMIRRAGT